MDQSPTLRKSTARSRGLHARRALGAESRSVASAAIGSALVGRPGFAAARTIAGYWPTEDEVDLVALWRHLVASGVHVCLPRIGPSGTTSMDFVRWDPTENMSVNRYGIPEPSGMPMALDELDVIVMPCCAVDDAGTRVGMGAGFYDRALMSFAQTPTTATGSATRPEAPAPDGNRPETDQLLSRQALLIGVAFDCQRVPQGIRIIAAAWDVKVDLVVTESVTLDATRGGPLR